MPEPEKDYVFSLFAPNNEEACLVADFSDWKELPMEKSDDGNFRISVSLSDGIYQYKFKIQSKSWFNEENEWKIINDPYATRVDEETQNSVLQLKNGEKVVDEYVWQYDLSPLPPNNQIVIYEMHVGDFSGGEDDPFKRGKYPNVVEKLDYLQELGVNALELMPLKESPGDYNWGYSPINYFASENSYGTTEQLKQLVDESHQLGMRVIVDGVYNHASSDCPLTQIDHDYWFHHEAKDPNMSWGPEFNYRFVDERFGYCPALKFIDDSLRFWIREFHIDGVRYDATKQIDNFEALQNFVNTTREMSSMKPFLNVAEYLPPEPAVTAPQGPMDGC